MPSRLRVGDKVHYSYDIDAMFFGTVSGGPSAIVAIDDDEYIVEQVGGELGHFFEYQLTVATQ